MLDIIEKIHNKNQELKRGIHLRPQDTVKAKPIDKTGYSLYQLSKGEHLKKSKWCTSCIDLENYCTSH